MEAKTWHSSFHPKNFLARVSLEKLIEHNQAYNENKVAQGNKPCLLCGGRQGPGILLNDKSYLCKNCFSEVSTISYPQVYEKARREYLKAKESRRIAFDEFKKTYGYNKQGNPALVFAGLSLVLLYFNIKLIAIPAVLFLIAYVVNFAQDKKLAEWNNKRDEWEERYPEPNPPKLRHFHDPKAQLTDKDFKILKIFNNWPGYPPFWNYLKEVVLARDGNHCQVSGCPSRVKLHIHHKIPVSKGGEHVPSNLVSLCIFHHALEPEEGHQRIWGD